MSNVDTRQVNRDSFFLLAQLKVASEAEEHRVKVRNLSAGGMMAEGDVKVSLGQLVSVQLRNIGWVEGSVAWAQGNRFGIAFIEQIDPKQARAPISAADDGRASQRFPNASPEEKRLRKL